RIFGNPATERWALHRAASTAEGFYKAISWVCQFHRYATELTGPCHYGNKFLHQQAEELLIHIADPESPGLYCLVRRSVRQAPDRDLLPGAVIHQVSIVRSQRFLPTPAMLYLSQYLSRAHVGPPVPICDAVPAPAGRRH